MAFLNKSPSLPTSNSLNLPSSETDKSKVSSVSSYAQVAQNDLFPKRNQGVIMECADGLSLTDYTCAIGDIVEPKNVLYSSRISNNRVCLYLKNQELVNNITDKYTTLNIKDKIVPIRPLVAKLKKVIISNVAPPIPHYIIENAFEAIDIRCLQPVTTLRAAINKDGYAHVLSSRRQTYIDPNDASKIPEFMKIDYDETNYYVYPSINATIKCFLCKTEGHIAKHCPAPPQQLNTQIVNTDTNIPSQNRTSDTIDNTSTAISNEGDSRDINLEENHAQSDFPLTTMDKLMMPAPSTGIKRNRSNTISTISSQNLDDKEGNTSKDQKLKIIKKIKTYSSKTDITKLKNMLQPAESFITEHADKFPIGFEKLVEFLDESYGKSNISEIALKYTTQISSFINLLAATQDYIQENNLKNRIKRIVKRLNDVNYITTDDESDDSSQE